MSTRSDPRTIDEQLTALFALDPAAMRDPYPLYERLREESPVHVFDPTTVIVSQHALAKTVYREHERFPPPDERGSQFEGRLRLLSEEDVRLYREFIDLERDRMNMMRGERHRRVRNAGQRAFTPARLKRMRESIEQLTEELLDDLARQDEPDFIDFAYRLPLLVIMDMMGAPHEDAAKLKHWGDLVNAPAGQSPLQPETVHAAYAANYEYIDYVRGLVERHRSDPQTTTLVADLLDASTDDQLTEIELVQIYVLLLFAGHETTANMFGNGLVALLEHRDQWELLCRDPSLAASAVEEVIRYDPPVQFFRKRTDVEQELGGVRIPARAYVLAANGAANRDPRVFADPTDLDITRRPNDQLAFGYGVHFCLGAGVARLEGQIGFEALARRFPDIELAADPGTFELNRHYSLRGISSIPVRLR